MPNPEVLLRRLRALESYLAVLRSLQRYAREEFLTNPEYMTCCRIVSMTS